jgi:CspA family cold shock protein
VPKAGFGFNSPETNEPKLSVAGEETIQFAICISASSRYREKVKHWEACEMAKGTVKWFNPTMGYGFIQPEGGGGKDVFVHISAVERAGLSSLNEGQIVEYEEVPNKGKTSAENLKVQR